MSQPNSPDAQFPARLSLLLGLIALAAIARLLPHPPNVSPVAAMALFGGACFLDKRLALLVPLLAMLLSDLILGFHSTMWVVYLAFAGVVGIGLWLRGRRSAGRIVVGALAASTLFFVTTNLAVWATGTLYPMTPAGLAECFIAAIPFYQNTLLGDLFFSGVLFGSFALAERRVSGPSATRRLHTAG